MPQAVAMVQVEDWQLVKGGKENKFSKKINLGCVVEENQPCWVRGGQAVQKTGIRDLGSGPLSGWRCGLARHKTLGKWAA